MAAQWVHLEAGKILVASRRGAWLQQPQLGAFGLAGRMPPSAAADPETTKHLLDGAIAAAERATRRGLEPTMTPLRWAWLLVNQWYMAHHSVGLLPAAIERYHSLARADLARFAADKLEEEQGHDQLSLADLRALGYDAGAAIAGVPIAPNVKGAIDHARECVHGDQPVDFIGYVYALERCVIRITRERLAKLDALLPRGVDATSAVRAHATELDPGHVNEIIAFVAALPAEDRTRIALGAYRSTAVLSDLVPHPSEEELEGWLVRFQRRARVQPSVLNTIQEGLDE